MPNRLTQRGRPRSRPLRLRQAQSHRPTQPRQASLAKQLLQIEERCRLGIVSRRRTSERVEQCSTMLRCCRLSDLDEQVGAQSVGSIAYVVLVALLFGVGCVEGCVEVFAGEDKGGEKPLTVA